MTDDPSTDRLVKEIGLRTFADHYLDRDEEREVVRIAGQIGLSEIEAHAAIANFCHETGIVREAEIRDAIRAKLSSVSGKIDRAAFDEIVVDAIDFCKKTLLERDVQRMVVSAMEETHRTNVKHGWFSNWFKDLKRELGVV